MLSFILGGAVASSIGTPADSSEAEVPAFNEFLVIPQRNIFRSQNRVDAGARAARGQEELAPAAALASIEVIGIIKTADPLSSMVIVIDNGRHVPCRVGDRVAGMLITEIRASEVFFETADGTRIVRIQSCKAPDSGLDSGRRLVDSGMRTRPPATIVQRRSAGGGFRVSVGAADIHYLVRRLPLAKHVENGRVRGLRLTGDVMGLREGDCVIQVGGQSLCTRRPRQKLLQMTWKYRQSGGEVPEIPVVVERAEQRIELVLVPFG